MNINILKPTASDKCTFISKEIIKKAGLNAAFLLAELINKYDYCKKHDKLTKDEFFKITAKDIEHTTILSAYQQREALSKLKELGIVETKFAGNANKYFKLNTENSVVKETLQLLK